MSERREEARKRGVRGERRVGGPLPCGSGGLPLERGWAAVLAGRLRLPTHSLVRDLVHGICTVISPLVSLTFHPKESHNDVRQENHFVLSSLPFLSFLALFPRVSSLLAVSRSFE